MNNTVEIFELNKEATYNIADIRPYTISNGEIYEKTVIAYDDTLIAYDENVNSRVQLWPTVPSDY